MAKEEELLPLTDLEDLVIKASSTLQRNTEEYGPRNVLDGEPDTCWSSDQGLPQHLDINFQQPVNIKSISMVFQGGFVGTEVKLSATPTSKRGDLSFKTTVFPEDNNEEQSFDVDISAVQRLRIEFTASSDFYGRIILYSVCVLGTLESS